MEGQNPNDKNKNQLVNIATMVRIRPLIHTQFEERQSISCEDSKTLLISMSGGKRQQKVDKIFSSQCTQRSVFNDIQHFLSKTSEGYNVTVFTYGQTGSGKTYTMFGSDWNNILQKNESQKSKQSTFLRSIQQDQNHAGLIPRTIHYVFNNLITKRRKYIKVYCSFLQLYNENMMDLFEDDKTKLNKKMLIHENKDDGIYVEGLNQIQVDGIEHCLQLMQKGQKNRTVRQTSMNVKSSRSHTLFQLLIQEVFPSKKSFRRMKINLCDLAGSEKINKAEKLEQDHFDELKNINLSLTTLGKVISSLSQKYLPPYRESKLTRLLQDSLGGNTYTAVIATITTKSSCLDESLNTLKFLQRAKTIKVNVINKVFNDNPEMRNLQKEIAYLKDVLKMKRTGVEVDVNSSQKLKKLQSQNHKLKQMIDRQLVQKLQQQNHFLRRQLDRKQNDDLVSQGNNKTIQPKQLKRDTIIMKQNSLKQGSQAAYSYSTGTNKVIRKQKKFLSTKTYTSKNDVASTVTNKEIKIFPSIKAIPQKTTVTSILSRIQQIERTKQANKLKLQHELTLMEQGRSLESKKTIGSLSKNSNRYKL